MEPVKFTTDLTAQDLNFYAAHVHDLNRKWWYNEDGSPILKTLHFPTRVMLMTSEVFEGFEGHRKGQPDDHLPAYPMLWVEMADTVIRVLDNVKGFGWELRSDREVGAFFKADCVESELLVLVDYIHFLGHVVISADENWMITPGQIAFDIIKQSKAIAEMTGCPDFWQVVYDKLVYNVSRADHSYAARAAEGGKKF